MAWLIRTWWVPLALALLIAVAGIWSWTRVPLDAIPDLSDNQVIVWAQWPGTSPEDIDEQVTRPLARNLQGLAGVRTVRGLSLQGSSYVYVIFDEQMPLTTARTRTSERLAQVQTALPAGVVPVLGPDATAMGQVFALTLQGGVDIERKRRILDQVVIPSLRSVAGVAEVAAAGGVVREYQIDVDPVRLEEQGMTLDMLMMAVRNAGRDVSAMSVEQSGIETMIRGRGFIRSAPDVENIVVKGNQQRNAGLLLGQLAKVSIGGAVRQGVLLDQHGEQAGAIVALRVGEDPTAVIAAIKRRLVELAPTLHSEGLVAIPFYDRSQLIRETAGTLERVLIEEILVTCLVIVAFLLHLRASIAVASALPIGVLATFIAMWALGLPANLMSLAGIAIAIGVMVDFGIVVCENVTQHLVRARQQGTDPVQAVIDGTREVSRALLTSAATTVVSFLPLFLLDDQAGRLFTPLAATKTLSISAAVLVGLLIVPVLCRLLLPPTPIRRSVLMTITALAAVATFAALIGHGLRIPLDHERLLLTVPGWLVAPLAAIVAGWVVWRLGVEQPVSYEDNPMSRGIAVVFDWALKHLLRHKIAFTLALATIAITGWLLGAGWANLSVPLRSAVTALGGDLAHLRADQWLQRTFPGIGASFLPPLDEGALLFMPSVPAAGGLGETQRILLAQNRAIAEVPEVASVMGKMGRAETALDPAPISMIETIVELKPYRDWPRHALSDADGQPQQRHRTLAEVRQALAAATDMPGVAPSWLQPIETRIVMLSTGIRAVMALQLEGDDGVALEQVALHAEQIISQVPGTSDVQVQRDGGKPYAEIHLDPERLARFGITAEQALATISTALGGMPATVSIEGNQRYQVRIRYARERRDDADELGLVQVPMTNGHGAIPLSSLVAHSQRYTLHFEGLSPEAWRKSQPLPIARALTVLGPNQAELVLPPGEALPDGIADPTAVRAPGFEPHGETHIRVVSRQDDPSAVAWTIGPMAIRSEAGRRIQYVLVNPRDRAEVDVVRDADAALRAALASGELSLPPGVTWRWVGRFEQKLKADRTMRWVIGISLAAMIALILIGTRSVLVTSVIVSCNVTVSVAGGLIAVWLAGAEMTTAVIVGFLVLLGVMFNDGILLGTYLHNLFAIPPTSVADIHQRVFLAGLRRRRPAIMTTCTTLLALIPILWNDGRGAEVMQPMVLPVVGGMIADLLSLFSVPVMYAWWWERKLQRSASLTSQA